MKKLILTSTTLATIFLTSSAFAQQTAEGVWSVKSRICSSGEAAQDGFELGEDSMHLAIHDSEIVVTVKMQGERFGDAGKIDQASQTISFGDSEKYDYVFSSKNELTIVVTGFEEGGSCNPGEVLYSVYERI